MKGRAPKLIAVIGFGASEPVEVTLKQFDGSANLIEAFLKR
jgi:hypothetical protein